MNKEELNKIIESEGDKKEFYYRGFLCLILRNGSLGNLCGYVGIPKIMTSLYEVEYDNIRIPCHGGLTFSGDMKEYPNTWFIGFDCAHSGDLCYYMLDYYNFSNNDIYRDMSYVESELREMVDYIYHEYPDAKSISREDYLSKIIDTDI